eukprot:8952004-Prorocentrum_lima.AAC.1
MLSPELRDTLGLAEANWMHAMGAEDGLIEVRRLHEQHWQLRDMLKSVRNQHESSPEDGHVYIWMDFQELQG